jgi:hypothetical protein
MIPSSQEISLGRWQFNDCFDVPGKFMIGGSAFVQKTKPGLLLQIVVNSQLSGTGNLSRFYE